MKTTISIPNSVYAAAEQLARRLDVPLNDLYTVALTTYINTHRSEGVTEALDRVYESEPSSLEPGLVQLQLLSIGGGEW